MQDDARDLAGESDKANWPSITSRGQRTYRADPGRRSPGPLSISLSQNRPSQQRRADVGLFC